MNITFKGKRFSALFKGISVLSALFLIFNCAACGKTQQTVSEPSGSLLDTAGVSSPADPLTGKYAASADVYRQRSDADEVRPSGNCAELITALSGGADAQANQLRNTILNAKNTVNNYKVSGSIYYISTDGNDLNDGKSEKTPLRSINALNSISLNSGDAVLFERGGIWRVTEPICAVDGIIYGSYGKGEKPTIYGSPKNYADANLWTPSNMKNVWKADFGYKDAGCIVFNHGKELGVKMQTGLKQLTQNGQFFHNEGDGIIYLYSDRGNPGRLYDDIEISPNSSIFYLAPYVSSVTIDNFCLKYCGKLAVDCGFSNNGVNVTNCEIGYIGGSNLSSTVRYGNGIQFWSGTENSNVAYNWIYQIFDTAISFQGTDGKNYINVNFNNNLMEYNDMDIELWDSQPNYEIRNCHVDNNIMRFNGYGWGTRLNDGGIRGGEVSLMLKFYSCSYCEISFKNNIIDKNNYRAVVFQKPPTSANHITVSGNTVFADSSHSNNIAVVIGTLVKDAAGQVFTAASTSKNYKADNQAELEAALRAFDPSPALVKWLS